jgi:hypothetical protein
VKKKRAYPQYTKGGKTTALDRQQACHKKREKERKRDKKRK